KNDGTKYEREIYNILESSQDTDSWMTNVRSGNGDKGVDTLSYYKDMSLMIQCKDHAKKVGIKHLRELNGIRPYDSNLLRIMVSKSGYTANVLKSRKKYKNLMLTDGKNLMPEQELDEALAILNKPKKEMGTQT
ncbi:16464_t:CDS:2, partial [Funneliformis geosporum]